MTDQPPVIVSGYGRCGSSMLMNVLRAGGVEWATGAQELSGEHESTWDAWLALQPGTAIKVLDPLAPAHEPLDQMIGCRIFWLERNLTEQVKSYVKFSEAGLITHVGVVPQRVRYPARKKKELRSAFELDRPDSLERLRCAGDVVVMRYEDALAVPQQFAQAVAEVLPEWPDFDVDAAAAVIHRRSPDCRPDLTYELTGVPS